MRPRDARLNKSARGLGAMETDGKDGVECALRIGGLTPFTTIDYPGLLSAVVFVQGCPWRCGYCHNPHLQPRTGVPDGTGLPTWAAVMALLGRRSGLLDAVVFSGGEPTIDAALANAMVDVRSLGMRVGLHTAGIYPRRLEELLPLVDWIGFDVKAPLDAPAIHDSVTGVRDSAAPVRQSVRRVLSSGVAHEFRTTAHPALLDDECLVRIGTGLAAAGATNFALQIYRESGPGASLGPVGPGYPRAETLSHLDGLFETFTLRRG